MPRRLDGIFVPVVTPFDSDDESLAIDAFTSNIRAHLAAGCTGVLVAGSTGEAALLDDNERVTLLIAARDTIPSDRLLIAGVGAESTRETIVRAGDAWKCGADAVLVVGPHYYPQSGTAAALRDHYRRVADASLVPVLLYNIPKYMHYAIPPEVVRDLAEHPQIIGMKDSSGDGALLGRYLEVQSSTFAVLTGHGGTVAAAVSAGVGGAILAVALFAPSLVHALWDAARAGRAQDAAFLQERLTPLARDIVGNLGVAGVKAALDTVGFTGGKVRAPLQSLSAIEQSRVKELLDAALDGSFSRS